MLRLINRRAKSSQLEIAPQHVNCGKALYDKNILYYLKKKKRIVLDDNEYLVYHYRNSSKPNEHRDQTKNCVIFTNRRFAKISNNKVICNVLHKEIKYVQLVSSHKGAVRSDKIVMTLLGGVSEGEGLGQGCNIDASANINSHKVAKFFLTVLQAEVAKISCDHMENNEEPTLRVTVVGANGLNVNKYPPFCRVCLKKNDIPSATREVHSIENPENTNTMNLSNPSWNKNLYFNLGYERNVLRDLSLGLVVWSGRDFLGQGVVRLQDVVPGKEITMQCNLAPKKTGKENKLVTGYVNLKLLANTANTLKEKQKAHFGRYLDDIPVVCVHGYRKAIPRVLVKMKDALFVRGALKNVVGLFETVVEPDVYNTAKEKLNHLTMTESEEVLHKVLRTEEIQKMCSVAGASYRPIKDQLQKKLGRDITEHEKRMITNILQRSHNESKINENVEDNMDSHIIANLIIVWLRECKEPILKNIHFADIMHCDSEEHVEKLIKKIPEPNSSVLFWLLDLLVEVSRHESVNDMSIKKLGAIFGPTLMSFPTDVVDNQGRMSLTQQQVKTKRLSLKFNLKMGKHSQPLIQMGKHSPPHILSRTSPNTSPQGSKRSPKKAPRPPPLPGKKKESNTATITEKKKSVGAWLL